MVPVILTIFQIFHDLIVVLHTPRHESALTSLNARQALHDLYIQLLLLINVNDIDYHNQIIIVRERYYATVNSIHFNFGTQQIGPLLDYPHI
jgi:hypothetical protein